MGGGQNVQKTVHVVYEWSLGLNVHMSPYETSRLWNDENRFHRLSNSQFVDIEI